MGACCSCHRIERFDGYYFEDQHHNHHDQKQHKPVERVVVRDHQDNNNHRVLERGDSGAFIRLDGYSKHVSMFNRQGQKGNNQDAMTVWENFTGDKDTFFCGVFDGHGPSGHLVAKYIRDYLPSKISATSGDSRATSISASSLAVDVGGDGKIDHDNNNNNNNPFLNSWKNRILKSFLEVDEDLEGNVAIESYCSGTTAVTVIKQKDQLVLANLGDSRAVICTRDDHGELVAQQLTVDLKPNLPNELERIKSCQGRVMAMESEPNVYRIWMPDEDCPGLAMSRAFGDFCLKDFGLVATPEVYYRRLSVNDEFLVLATDGIWDVLSNADVIRIVASARKRSMAAKLLIDRAIRAWRYKYPCVKIDDCAVICLFFKRPRPSLTKSVSEVSEISLSYSEIEARSHLSAKTDDALDTVLNCEVNKNHTAEEEEEAAANSNNNNNNSHGPQSRRRRRTGMNPENGT